jgi:hypothetical protein
MMQVYHLAHFWMNKNIAPGHLASIRIFLKHGNSRVGSVKVHRFQPYQKPKILRAKIPLFNHYC